MWVSPIGELPTKFAVLNELSCNSTIVLDMLTDQIESVKMYGTTTVKKYNWRNYREPWPLCFTCVTSSPGTDPLSLSFLYHVWPLVLLYKTFAIKERHGCECADDTRHHHAERHRQPLSQIRQYCSLRSFFFEKIELITRRHAEVTYDNTREKKEKFLSGWLGGLFNERLV
jgi:hypothetical protein